MLLIIGDVLFKTGTVIGLVGVAIGVLSHWGIIASDRSKPSPVLYFIDKTWWLYLILGVLIGFVGHELQEASKGNLKFEWTMLAYPLIIAAFFFVGYIVIREALAGAKKLMD